MAKIVTSVYISVHQFDDAYVALRVHHQHHGLEVDRDVILPALPDPVDIELSLNGFLDALEFAAGWPTLPTIQLQRPATPPAGAEQLSLTDDAGVSDAEYRRG